jgi:hypothetical protein
MRAGMRSYVAALFVATLGWQGGVQAAPVAPASGTWVGMDGRSYYVAPAPPLDAEEAAEAEEAARPVELDKHGRPRRKVNVGMTVAGGVFAGVGLLAFVGGLAGYFATIECTNPAGLFNVRCTDHKEILWVSAGGIVSAVAVGTPLLVVGLRRPPKNEIEKPAEEQASVSFSVGAVSGVSVRF